jgi:hypothetical protein
MVECAEESSPFPAPNYLRGNFCLHPHPHGGIFVPIPTDPHGSCRDPQISNINKNLYFSVKIMIVVWRYFFFFDLKKQIFYIFFLKNKTNT